MSEELKPGDEIVYVVGETRKPKKGEVFLLDGAMFVNDGSVIEKHPILTRTIRRAAEPTMPTNDWRAKCVVEQAKDGWWRVLSPDRAHWLGSYLNGPAWVALALSADTVQYGWTWHDEPRARAALAAAPPPPGYEDHVVEPNKMVTTVEQTGGTIEYPGDPLRARLLDPPEGMVEKLVQVWRETNAGNAGSVRAVLRCAATWKPTPVVESPEAIAERIAVLTTRHYTTLDEIRTAIAAAIRAERERLAEKPEAKP